ncbi:hypothetical protein J4418_04990 [Candidatus Woesearchaeota archaeon]|nr:hypothetical protein [Candidatus Woesearchaeota archaeon]
MKKIITILLILMIGLVMVSGCDINTNDSNSIPQPPSLPDDDNQQQDGSDAIPQPPTLPEE